MKDKPPEPDALLPKAREPHRLTARQAAAMGEVEGIHLRPATRAILDRGRREGWTVEETVARLRAHFTEHK